VKRRAWTAGLGVVALLAAAAAPAAAFDADRTFARGTRVLSVEGGYGRQFNLENKSTFSDIEFLVLGTRVSLLPFGQSGSGVFKGAFEVGLEPIFLTYLEPKSAYYAGLAAMTRYHFTSLGAFVPYVELGGAAGGTNLKVVEIRSDFAFLLMGGVGAEYFVSDTMALYAGWRWTHNSNGNTSKPNRGWEANTGIVGASFYFH
jgi:hypothetical protein